MDKVKEKTSHMEKQLCAVCNVRMNEINMKQHLNGKKHISLLNKVKKKKRTEEQSCSEGVYVTGISMSISNTTLLEHFKSFGQVIAIQRDETDNQVLLQFKTRNQARAVLKSSHNVGESVLVVRPRKAVQHQTTAPKDGVVNHIKILKNVLEESLRTNPELSIDEQIRLLVTALEVTEEEKHQQTQIISTLEEWLSLQFPSCRLHLFGSSVSGLAFRGGSDLDIFMETPINATTPSDKEPFSSQEETLEKQPENVLAVLRRACHIISRHPDVSDSFVVSHARIPVLKFVHSPTGIECDLTCNNIIAVQNSKLLFALQSLDARIRPYLYALKFWAKSHRLISSPESSLSSYAFTLMAVFYLQQIDPPLIPSVESLQNAVPVEERMFCNGRNISYRVPSVAASVNTASETTIMDLLIGFFHYYQNFNASEMVVCPLQGKLAPKTEFKDSTRSANEEVTCKDENLDLRPPLKLSLLSVQDPFELDFNVCFNFRHFELFQSLCKSAEHTCMRILDVKEEAKILDLFKTDVKKKLKKKELHTKILDPLKTDVKKKLPDTKVLIPLKTNVKKKLSDTKVVESPLQTPVYLSFKPIHDGTSPEEESNLVRSVGQFVGDLFSFSYGFLFEENTQTKKKRRKIDPELSIPDESGFKWKTNYIMTVPFDVCSKKREELASKVLNEIDAKSVLDRERAITSLLYGTSPDNVTPFAVLNFSMSCSVDPSNVILHFGSTVCPKKIFWKLVQDVQRCVKKSVKDHLVANKLQFNLK
ncbi:hypothetical protein GHT06_013725 [Daphnia sinensis]|uniref:Speckle targeted PIP5K1A-regulated poly(A) polymerase n=1 Tax=Daphnia sinensis TaxID=1820382 RepID=A0AAD5LBN4_9CRUS|nr:hypothetical protein GHT06_013725 [Daphnia sinensis]